MFRFLVILPVLIVLGVFLYCNQDPVQMSMPGGFAWKSSVGIFVLIVSFFSFMLGLIVAWFSELRQRRRARRAEQQVKALEAQIAELRQQYAHVYNPEPAPAQAG